IHDSDDRAVDDGTSVDGCYDIVLAIKTANQRNHCLRNRFTLFPVSKAAIHFVLTHDRSPLKSEQNNMRAPIITVHVPGGNEPTDERRVGKAGRSRKIRSN